MSVLAPQPSSEPATRRSDDGRRRSTPDVEYQAFVRWMVGFVLVGLAAVAAFNWYVDPTGVTGRTTTWQVSDNATTRSTKLDLYLGALRAGRAPEVVLLGSSRTMKFHPDTVRELTGARTLNAAVNGATPRDAWLMAKLLRERQGETFPHLVWGLDADAFRDKQLRDGLSIDPRVARFVPRSERIATMVASLGSLTEWQVVKASVRSLQRGGTSAAERRSRYTIDGFQRTSRRFETRDRLRNQAIRRQVANYATFVFGRDSWDHVEDGPWREFVEALEIANAHGDVPTIFVTPYHPLAEELLEQRGLDARRAEVLDRLEALARGGDVRFELLDLSDPASFGGDDREWYDGIHMTRKNTDRVLRLLHRRELLAPR